MVLVKAKVVDSTHLELLKPIAARKGLTVLVSVAESGDKDAERHARLLRNPGKHLMANLKEAPSNAMNADK